MESPPIRDDGLQLDERRAFQRGFWTVERLAWVLFTLFLLMALLGLTGMEGYLARTTLSSPGGAVDYPRIARWEAPEEVNVTFNAGQESHSLTLGPVFLDHFQIQGIQPQPESTRATENGIRIQFAAEANAPAKVILYLRPLQPGFPTYSIAIDGSEHQVWTAILP